MLDFTSLCKKLSNNGLGELLRAITFVGSDSDYGCYTTFDVVPDAERWSEEDYWRFCWEYGLFTGDGLYSHGAGYTYVEDGITVDAVWMWDGDGALCFRLTEGGEVGRVIINHDCKYSNEWESVDKRSLPEMRNHYEGFSPSSDLVKLLDPDRLFNQGA